MTYLTSQILLYTLITFECTFLFLSRQVHRNYTYVLQLRQILFNKGNNFLINTSMASNILYKKLQSHRENHEKVIKFCNF